MSGAQIWIGGGGVKGGGNRGERGVELERVWGGGSRAWLGGSNPSSRCAVCGAAHSLQSRGWVGGWVDGWGGGGVGWGGIGRCVDESVARNTREPLKSPKSPR